MLRTQIHKAKRTLWKRRDGTQHLTVLLYQLGWGRVLRPLESHVNTQPLDAHAIRIHEQRFEAFLRRKSGNTRHVTVQIPDAHAED